MHVRFYRGYQQYTWFLSLCPQYARLIKSTPSAVRMIDQIYFRQQYAWSIWITAK